MLRDVVVKKHTVLLLIQYTLVTKKAELIM